MDAARGATGEVLGRVRRRHRATEFRRFLAQIDRATPPDLALHLIVDNSSTHTTDAIGEFLAAHPRIHLHFTPTSASWLNAVESWFGQVERRALRRGVFTSVTEVRDAIRRFIDAHNAYAAKPFRWTKSAEAILDAVEHARLAASVAPAVKACGIDLLQTLRHWPARRRGPASARCTLRSTDNEVPEPPPGARSVNARGILPDPPPHAHALGRQHAPAPLPHWTPV